MFFFPLRYTFASTKDTFTSIGRNLSSGEIDKFFVYLNSFARRKFCPTKFRPIRYISLGSKANKIKSSLIYQTSICVVEKWFMKITKRSIEWFSYIQIFTDNTIFHLSKQILNSKSIPKSDCNTLGNIINNFRKAPLVT